MTRSVPVASVKVLVLLDIGRDIKLYRCVVKAPKKFIRAGSHKDVAIERSIVQGFSRNSIAIDENDSASAGLFNKLWWGNTVDNILVLEDGNVKVKQSRVQKISERKK